jgi:hypothetical protein
MSTTRYIAIETAISAGINAALSIAFAIVVFGGQPVLDLHARAVLLDLLPQGFMIAFMATLVPTLLTRRRRDMAKVAALPGRHALPRNVVVRALLFGAAAALLGTGAFAVLQPEALLAAPLFIALKAAYGALLAIIVTPIALRAALRDPPQSARVDLSHD